MTAALNPFLLPRGPEIDPFWDHVAFLMYGEGADGSTAFYDRSQYNRPCVTFGSAQVDTDISVAGSPSIKLGADGTHVRRNFGYELVLSGPTGPDFCFEAYIYLTSITSGINQIFGRRRNEDNYTMVITTANELVFSSFNGTTGTTRLSVPAGLSLNTVHHVCVIRVGTTYYGFVDGVLKGTNVSSSAFGVSTTALFIGESENDQPARYLYGNVNWLRMTVGVPRYSLAGFTPPSTPYPTGRPNPVATPSATLSNVMMLCGFNGPDGAVTYTDETSYARPATFYGNAKLDASQSKFGSASLYLDGSGDFITFPDAAEIRVPTGSTAADSFCVEAWVRLPSIKAGNATIATKRSAAGLGEFNFYLDNGIPGFFTHSSSNGSVVIIEDRVPLAINQWHHIAASVVGVFVRLFVNGVCVAVGCRSASPTTNVSTFHIGRDPYVTSRDFLGWIDEFRFTKGEPVYTQTFIPPQTAFPRF